MWTFLATGSSLTSYTVPVASEGDNTIVTQQEMAAPNCNIWSVVFFGYYAIPNNPICRYFHFSVVIFKFLISALTFSNTVLIFKTVNLLHTLNVHTHAHAQNSILCAVQLSNTYLKYLLHCIRSQGGTVLRCTQLLVSKGLWFRDDSKNKWKTVAFNKFQRSSDNSDKILQKR